MRLLSFLPPDASAPRVGIVGGRGDRVVDLSAIGVEDMFDAAARTEVLRRAAPHLLRASGALAYPTGAVRALAPLPVARTAWAAVARGGPSLRYADPAPIAPPDGGTLAREVLGGLRVGVACVIGAEAHAVGEGGAERAIAGYCAVAWIPRGAGDGETAAGPWLVTPDELADRRVRPGVYDLEMRWTANGGTLYEGSWTELPIGVTAVVVAAAAQFTLRPGDMLCVPAGEGRGRDVLGGATLAPGDELVFEVERLGALRWRIAAPTEPIQ